MKRILLALSLPILFALPAHASNWQYQGVSSRGETVVLDTDSIRVNSQYDVTFRYQIGKDLVYATANCDSSLIRPHIGSAFVPNPTGATRNMLNTVCQRPNRVYRPVVEATISQRICNDLDNGYSPLAIRDKIVSLTSDLNYTYAQLKAGANLLVVRAISTECPRHAALLN